MLLRSFSLKLRYLTPFLVRKSEIHHEVSGDDNYICTYLAMNKEEPLRIGYKQTTYFARGYININSIAGFTRNFR